MTERLDNISEQMAQRAKTLEAHSADPDSPVADLLLKAAVSLGYSVLDLVFTQVIDDISSLPEAEQTQIDTLRELGDSGVLDDTVVADGISKIYEQAGIGSTCLLYTSPSPRDA